MDKEEFTRAVLEYESTLYRVAKSMLGSEADCADAAQNALLRAWEKQHTLRDTAYFKTWLTRILINECRAMLRQRARFAPLEEEAAEGEIAPERDSVLFDSSSRTGIVSLRLENLKGDGKMPFKVAELLPEYRDQPNVSWTALASTYANADGECWFDVLNAAGTSAFTGEYYLDTQRSTENVYYLEAALIAYEDYSAGDALTLGMYQHGKDAAVLSVDIPEPQALPSVSSGDGAVTLSQVGLRVELATAEVAVDAIDYVALRMADGSELVIIDKANGIDRTLYALGTASDPSEGSTENVATYLLAAAPELENVRSVVINDIEYQLS